MVYSLISNFHILFVLPKGIRLFLVFRFLLILHMFNWNIKIPKMTRPLFFVKNQMSDLMAMIQRGINWQSFLLTGYD